MAMTNIQPFSLEDALVQALRSAGHYNLNDQIPPAAILWPDKARQWEVLLPALRKQLPLLTLGIYDPAIRTGPAYYLRCQMARTLAEDSLPAGYTPIIYLPGYGKQDLRAIEECPKELQPLAELQYRGVLWVHRNGRDWTVSSFLHQLDILVAGDNATREALGRALQSLARESLNVLRQASPLRASYLNQLLNPDPPRQLLLWLNDPESYQQVLTPVEWAAFVALCQQEYGFNPLQDGPITAAQQLVTQGGKWPAVWQRYVEAPGAYPNLPQQLERARPLQQLTLFDRQPSPYWPQDTASAESKLREKLLSLREKSSPEVRAHLTILESEHGVRRSWVWADLGQAPLAQALAHLSQVAQLTMQALGGSTVTKIAEAYTTVGWQVDAAVLDALACVSRVDDVEAVKIAVTPIYRPWLESAANQMLTAILAELPTTGQADISAEVGDCLLFCDALRFDMAQRVAVMLSKANLITTVDWRLAALPSVTGTAKPAVTPVANRLEGRSIGLTPSVRGNTTPLNASALRKLLVDDGYQVLGADETGHPTGKAWTEFGAIDQYGHRHQWRLAHYIHDVLQQLTERIITLLSAGWQRVIIITDHGWILLPLGLPKAELPLHLTHIRKGRCAILKQGVQTDQPVITWHWNSDVHIAVAPGIGCYEAGKEYEHGGISPQECIVPVLTIRALALED